MAAIFIESNNTKSLKLLTELAEQLGVTVSKLTKPETEKLHSDLLIKKGKTDKKVSNENLNQERISALKNTGNPFVNLRKRIKNKMTNEQIDKQMQSLRAEWQRDI